ncbi:MAG: transglutaminase-like domain-containing protein [Rhodospirillaceae bacterium]
MTNRTEARDYLRKAGEQPDEAIELAEAALMLAALDRPTGDLDGYRNHLAELAADVAGRVPEGMADDLGCRVAALRETLVNRYGYQGDTETYEDIQNANLMSVIDRRRGMPVALGILFLHVARVREWDMVGLNFPGHFLVRLDAGGERVIIDPFRKGQECSAVDLRELLKATAGLTAELEPDHYAPVDNRSILLRLQNNIKLRHLRNNNPAKALEVLEDMVLFAPQEPALWRETGLLRGHFGSLNGAIAALEKFMDMSDNDPALHQTALIIQQLRNRLN